MKKLVVFDGQLQPNLGGQFKLESGGQFTPKLLVNRSEERRGGKEF